MGYYGYRDDGAGLVDEASPAGTDWWGRDSERWEAASRAAERLGLRTVALRTSWFLDPESLAPQVEPFRRGVGGWVLPGNAWRPWIHPVDEIRLIEFALDEERVSGPLNCTAPNPVTEVHSKISDLEQRRLYREKYSESLRRLSTPGSAADKRIDGLISEIGTWLGRVEARTREGL